MNWSDRFRQIPPAEREASFGVDFGVGTVIPVSTPSTVNPGEAVAAAKVLGVLGVLIVGMAVANRQGWIRV